MVKIPDMARRFKEAREPLERYNMRYEEKPLVNRNDIVFRILVETANKGVPHNEHVILVSYTKPSEKGIVYAQLGYASHNMLSMRAYLIIFFVKSIHFR